MPRADEVLRVDPPDDALLRDDDPLDSAVLREGEPLDADELLREPIEDDLGLDVDAEFEPPPRDEVDFDFDEPDRDAEDLDPAPDAVFLELDPDVPDFRLEAFLVVAILFSSLICSTVAEYETRVVQTRYHSFMRDFGSADYAFLFRISARWKPFSRSTFRYKTFVGARLETTRHDEFPVLDLAERCAKFLLFTWTFTCGTGRKFFS